MSVAPVSPAEAEHGGLAGHVPRHERGVARHVVLPHRVVPLHRLLTKPLLRLPLVLSKPRIPGVFASLGSGQGVFHTAGVDWSPRGNVDLLTSVLIESYTDSLECGIAASGTELLLHDRSGEEALVAAENPSFSLCYDHTVGSNQIETHLFTNVLHGKVCRHQSYCHSLWLFLVINRLLLPFWF